MFPSELKILLGAPPTSEQSQQMRSRPKSRFFDWLTFNGLTAEVVRRLLEAIEPRDNVEPTPQPSSAPISLSANEAWSLCAAAVKEAFPVLRSAVERIEDRAPKCLLPTATKHPKPFTYDLGFGKLPFVSLHYQNRPADLIAMAHEFGHALQIVASWPSGEGQMPPVARETCAFLTELAVLQHCKGRFAGLAAAHRADTASYFGQHAAMLEAALQDGTTPYCYEWNYPLARHSAAFVHSKYHDRAPVLYTAGREGGQYLLRSLGVMASHKGAA